MNIKITIKEFETEVLKAENLSLVQFKTEWNGACEIIAPIYEDLAKLYKHVAKFFTMDADMEKAVLEKFHINETPAILFFQKGTVIDYSVGLTSKNTLVLKIETALSQITN